MKENKTIYKIYQCILGFIYKLWYNPKIIGKENIPSSGPIIIAGNHIHIMDQCNVVIATKRCIHYMAKKEYFDNKKVAWFFKSCQCIPVDRNIKDEKAKDAAIEVLENNYALGIFPEGTRNNLKDKRIKELYDTYSKEEMNYEDFYNKIKDNKTSHIDYLEELKNKKIITEEEFLDNIYNVKEFLYILISEHRITREEYYEHSLLPFKFGAVSMASKTDAYIVPYAITGDYKFRSKNLTTRIGKPFKVDNDLEKANQRLRTEMINLMKENLQNNGK